MCFDALPKKLQLLFYHRIRASCQRIGLVPGAPQRRHYTSVFHSLGIGFKSLGDFDHALNFLPSTSLPRDLSVPLSFFIMAAARPRPYRRILTSALHRRFVHASALALSVCYFVAFLLGDKSSCKWHGLQVVKFCIGLFLIAAVGS